MEEALDLEVELFSDGYFEDRRIVILTVSAYYTPPLQARGDCLVFIPLPTDHPWTKPPRSTVTTLIGGHPRRPAYSTVKYWFPAVSVAALLRHADRGDVGRVVEVASEAADPPVVQ